MAAVPSALVQQGGPQPPDLAVPFGPAVEGQLDVVEPRLGEQVRVSARARQEIDAAEVVAGERLTAQREADPRLAPGVGIELERGDDRVDILRAGRAVDVRIRTAAHFEREPAPLRGAELRWRTGERSARPRAGGRCARRARSVCARRHSCPSGRGSARARAAPGWHSAARPGGREGPRQRRPGRRFSRAAPPIESALRREARDGRPGSALRGPRPRRNSHRLRRACRRARRAAPHWRGRNLARPGMRDVAGA